MTKAEDFLSPLTQSHILMNKAQAALWLYQAGFDTREIAKVVELPGLLPVDKLPGKEASGTR